MAYLLLPATAALLYACGAHVLKMSMGVGPWRITFLSNLTMAVLFIPLLLVEAPQPHVDASYYQPAFTAAAFFLGQLFTFFAINRGDVSVATPVMGLKVLLVTILTPLLIGTAVPGLTWIAAILSMLAIILLGIGKAEDRNKTGMTIFLSSLSALFFATCDVLVQKWTPLWGAQRFIPAMFGINALFTFGLLPFFSSPLSSIPAGTWKYILPGCLLIAMQALLMALVLGIFGEAPSVNIIYSSRGVWSVLIVFVAARYLHEGEQNLQRGILLYRLAGSILLIGAIALILF